MLFWNASSTWDTFSSASRAALSGGMISSCIISGSGFAGAFLGFAAGFAVAVVALSSPATSFFSLTVVEVEDSCTAEQGATGGPARGKATTSGSRFPKSGAEEHLHTAWPVGGLTLSECEG